MQMSEAGVWASEVPDYREENVSMKVVKIIQSYVSVINRMVWMK